MKKYIKNLPFGETIILPYVRRLLNFVIQTPQRLRAARAIKSVSKKDSNLNVVVIVTSSVHGRICKIAYALRSSNYKVILLHSDPGFCYFEPEISSLFDEVLTYDSPEDAVIKAVLYKPIAYHIFCNWNYNVAKMFVQMCPGVVVVDTKDVLGGFVRPQILKKYPLQEKAERFCFENADGICCSDTRTQYLKRYLGYRLSARLFLPDYCWPVGFTRRQTKRSNGRHVAYVGSIDVDPSSPDVFSYELARLLAKVGINFHIYPSFHSHASKLRDEMKNFVTQDLMQYIHIHDTLPLLSLSGELSTFNAGILISTNKVNYGNHHKTYYAFMEEYLIASKLFDYYEAGLLCLTQKMRMTKYMFPRNGIVREVRSLEEIVEIVSTMEIREIEVEPKLRLDYHAHRLSEFYLRLYRQKSEQAQPQSNR